MDHSVLQGSTIPSPSAVKDELEPVRKTRIYEEVASQIQRLISEGRLRPGDHLPPERELAERFGVSRTSVRDAIRVLELMGLLEPRQGEGTVVRDLSPDSLVNPLHWRVAGDRRILDAIRRRDADAAEVAMRQHLEEIEDVLLRSKASRVGG